MQEPYPNNGSGENSYAPLQQSPMEAAPATKPVAKRKPKVKRDKLTQANIGALWSRLGRAVEGFCDAQGSACPLCTVAGKKVKFQLTQDCDEVELTLKGRQVWKRIRRRRQSIPIVRLKTGSAAFDCGPMRCTATHFAIEVIREARGLSVNE